MNIERFKYFLDLSETLNYTETAEHFFTTQSNVSKQIIALEKELDISLFLREHRSITLTAAGKALLPFASKLIRDYQELQNELLPFQNNHKSTLRISAIPVMMNYNITGIIASFHHTYPHIVLDIKEVESINLKKELDEDHCDIAYMRIFGSDFDDYEKVVVDRDKFVAVLPVSHSLAKCKSIQLASLKQEMFYQLDKFTQLYNQFFQLCNNAGFEPNVAYTGTRIENILDFVSKGMGISLMMEHSINLSNYPGLVMVPLDITIESDLVFIRPKCKHHSADSNYFWKFISKQFS